MNEEAIDRIREASFSQARKGYDRREVDSFLGRLADWLDHEGAEEAHAHLVRRELERIGEQTTAILTEAHDAAETMRMDADRQVRQLLADANIKADAMRTKADEYAEEVREEADAYARRTRSSADVEAEDARSEALTALEDARARADEQTSELRTEADEYVARVRAEADEYLEKRRAEADAALADANADGERTAKGLIEDANRRKGEIEKVISDLEHRRRATIAELRRLAQDVAGAAGESGGAAPSGDDRAAQRDDATEEAPVKQR